MLHIHKFTIALLILHEVFSLENRETSLHVIPIEDAPYLTLVLCTNSKYFCTGTIVHKLWVLTSAHCFYNTAGRITEDDTSVLVVSGTNSLAHAARDIELGVAQIRKSEKLIIHNNYQFSSNFLADLALVQLDEPFHMTNRSKIAPLYVKPSKCVIEERSCSSTIGCTVFGYGKVFLNKDHAYDDCLKKQSFALSKDCECLDRVWTLRFRVDVMSTRTLLCDNGHQDFSGLCSGDQGAPLIRNKLLRGVATAAIQFSDRRNCGFQDVPNECGSPQTMYVFTDLCLYSQWLSYHVPKYPLVDDSCEPLQMI